MVRTVIVSVGTSLLTNRDEQVGDRARPWKGWRRGEALPESGNAALFLATADPIRASAETHTLARLPLREPGLDAIAWLHSDTPEGSWCAAALCAHYAGRGYPGSPHRLTGLGYHGATFAERGLRSLLSVTFDLIAQAGGPDYVTLCATGGFKAELAYINVVGLLLGIDVYYVSDQFDELVGLPRLPLRWDLTWVEANAAFFAWIDDEPRRSSDVENRLKAAPDLRPLVAEGNDGNSYLAPAGDLLYRAYREHARQIPRATWPPPSPRSPQEKNGLSGIAHHRPAGWEGWVQRLAALDCVTNIRYDDSGAGHGGVHPRIYAEDAATGTLCLIVGRGAEQLPLRVETTARGEGQLGLVRGWIEHNMKGW